ncbi:MAG: hypothetical protein H0V89_12890 [Deltaproteobacteria bacterium]|nr:hypothetical protein [Deltaproteobacteria bacterium]
MIILALAATSAWGQAVAVLGAAADPTSNVMIRTLLMTTNDFDSVTLFDVAATTPTLADLNGFHAAFVWSDVAFADATALGDVLADYIEADHGVVFAGGAFATGTEIGGRAVTAGYLPVSVGPLSFSGGNLGHVIVEGDSWRPGQVDGHDSVYGVNTFDGGSWSTHVVDLTLVPLAYTTIEWTDGEPLTVVRDPGDPSIGRTAAVNIRPLPDVVNDPPRDWWYYAMSPASSDGDRMLSQALLWTLGVYRPVGATTPSSRRTSTATVSMSRRKCQSTSRIRCATTATRGPASRSTTTITTTTTRPGAAASSWRTTTSTRTAAWIRATGTFSSAMARHRPTAAAIPTPGSAMVRRSATSRSTTMATGTLRTAMGTGGSAPVCSTTATTATQA